jgi:hypothetical protein
MQVPPFPSVFKEGWLRLNKKIPFLSGADGVVGIDDVFRNAIVRRGSILDHY